MTSLRSLALCALFCFALLPAASFALPPGSYQNSCYQCKVGNDKLRCVCLQMNHRPNYTVLPGVRNCAAISNQNGTLRCDQRRSRALPHGSYRQTCVGCFFDGKRLSCSCRTRGGAYWQRSAIPNVRRCQTDIQNINGQLRCRAYRDRPLPQGSYQRSCINCRATGQRLSCLCRRVNQRYQHTTLRRPYRCATIENLDGELSCRR